MSDVLLMLISGVWSIVVPAVIITRDMRQLTPHQASRGWNTASFWSAVVNFGPLAIVVHFVRTRRSVYGALLGIAWATATVAAVTLLGSLFVD